MGQGPVVVGACVWEVERLEMGGHGQAFGN
jgi:hypothetical protein